jgi:membrane protein implicated in regulation of membrane protease activity
MYLIAIGWIYVVVMMAVAEAVGSNGTVLGAIITLVLYGVLPLALVMYLLGTPGRRRRLRALDAASVDPDAGGHASAPPQGDAVAPVRKEP